MGRAEEWQRLLQTFEEVQAGHGRIVRVMGEAGLGKSRLVADIVKAYYAHPTSWNEIGFGGPASPRGCGSGASSPASRTL